VVYFPKFFHPDPTVERQSGLLKPQLGSHNTLGNSIYIPWFQIISDSKDVTIKPRLYNDNKFVLQNEYRQITDNSLTIIDMSIAKGHDSSSSDKNNTRSHFYSNTKVNLDFEKFINSTLEINYEHTNNDNYLTLFNLEGPLLKGGNVLESSVQLKLDHEDYNFSTSIEAFETLSGSNSDRYQYVLPSFNFGTNFDINQLPGSFNFFLH
ncbi:organic solvent tolerance protein, partial [Candidatus Pelagibacter ubique]|nr:organic solvent tolerance protein [Candidatus Pelagibacter ubique]